MYDIKLTVQRSHHTTMRSLLVQIYNVDFFMYSYSGSAIYIWHAITFLSVSPTVWCIDSVPVGGDNYVTLYNGNDVASDIDNVNTFRFSCMVCHFYYCTYYNPITMISSFVRSKLLTLISSCNNLVPLFLSCSKNIHD